MTYSVSRIPTDITGLSYSPLLMDYSMDADLPGYEWDHIPKQEVSPIEFLTVSDIMSQFKHTPINIMEIGVCRSGLDSFTHALLNKHPESKYLGVDIEDKTFLDNTDNNIHTLLCDSINQTAIRAKLEELSMLPLTILFIDGWHSVNMMINDWKYSDLIVSGGYIFIHDINMHPGPNTIMDAIDTNIYEVNNPLINVSNIFGLGVIKKK